MKILISGSSGLIGKALLQHLSSNHEINILVRRKPQAGNEFYWNPTEENIDKAAFKNVEAVINLSGAGIANRRWTKKYKQKLIDSRTLTTKLLSKTISSLDDGPECFLSWSAVGIYGNTGSEKISESHSPGDTFLSQLCVQWEESSLINSNKRTRICQMRTGIVLSQNGGILPKMLIPFKMFVGGKLGNGKQYVSWITINDLTRAVEFVLESKIEGPVNLTSPNPVTNEDMTKMIGKKINRPTVFTVPKFLAQTVLGKELAQNLLFDSQRVIPKVLTDTGFKFQSETFQNGLDTVLK